MADVNKVTVLGRLGADPEIRYTQDGNSIANFTVATSERWKDRNTGEKQERSEWHRCVAFRQLGSFAEQYLRKGARVYIEGKMQTRSFERDGQKKYTTEIVCREIQPIDWPDRNEQRAPQESRRQQAQAASQLEPEDFDDDIPF